MVLRLNSVFGVYRRSFLCPGGSEELFSFLRAAPSCILDLPTPFLCQAQSLSLPKQALSKSTHVLINHAKVQRKVHESEDAACPSTMPHAFSVKERLQFVELGAHDEGDSHDPHGARLAVAACRNNSQLKKKVRTWRPAHRRSYGRHVLTFFLS